jgi:hypothetical protein
MIKQFLLAFLLLTGIFTRGQENINLDSLKELLAIAKNDSARFAQYLVFFCFMLTPTPIVL